MAKDKEKIYICDNCGHELLKWQGQCPSCGDWNTIKEVVKKVSPKSKSKGSKIKPQRLAKIDYDDEKRLKTKIGEFDRVLGGGFVKGSLLLLGGEPGIGKSTILLQVADKIKGKALYLSGEESAGQIKLRSDRLGLKGGNVEIISSQDINQVFENINDSYQLLIVDSIQTVYDSDQNTKTGGVAQIKGVAYQLGELAQKYGLTVIITGHITKQGRIAGPKTLEHLVDTVLYLEGDKYQDKRIIRATKNRFGSTGEVGVFEMSSKGLKQITDPSKLFIAHRSDSAGSVITSTIEGQRAMLLEVQALTEKTIYGYPKRRSEGIPLNRVEMLSAVISGRSKLNLSETDIYVNIVGGIKVKEPSVDLAICLAIASSKLNKAVDSKTIFFGEVGLSGEVRPVPQLKKRLKEAAKLGFKKALIPDMGKKKFKSKRIKIEQVGTLKQAIKKVFH